MTLCLFLQMKPPCLPVSPEALTRCGKEVVALPQVAWEQIHPLWTWAWEALSSLLISHLSLSLRRGEIKILVKITQIGQKCQPALGPHQLLPAGLSSSYCRVGAVGEGSPLLHPESPASPVGPALINPLLLSKLHCPKGRPN